MSSEALRLLGLALRAARLTTGEDLCREAVSEHRARLLLLASDTGESTRRRFQRLSGEKLPLIVLEQDKTELGAALGRESCAVCALTDLGFASRVASLLCGERPELEEVAEKLSQRQEKALRRKKTKPKKK